MHWYACYTRARSEKKVAERLEGKGVSCYLPLIPRVRQWADRKKVVEWPAFPGYVFCRFRDTDYRDVLTTPGIATVLGSGGEPAPIPDEEIENVRRFVDGIAATGQEPEPGHAFREGQAVRVVRGPFQGVVGRVREIRGRKRLLVGIRGIGQALEVDIPAEAIESLTKKGGAERPG